MRSCSAASVCPAMHVCPLTSDESCVIVCVCLCMVLSSCVAVCVCVSTSAVRSGYRLTSKPEQNSMRVLYDIEKELAQFPSSTVVALKRKPAQIRPASVWQRVSVSFLCANSSFLLDNLVICTCLLAFSYK